MPSNTHYPQKLLRKSRDAGYLKDSRVKYKEYWETNDTVKKGVLSVLKGSNVSRFHTVYDFCGSHGFNIPYIIARNKAKYGIAIDIKPSKASKRLWSYYSQFAARMQYKQEDIYKTEYDLENNSLVLAVHSCRGLALRACDIAIDNRTPIVVVPCCVGRIDPFYAAFENIAHYDKWCLTVAQRLTKSGYDISVRSIRKSATPVGTIIIGIPPKP